MRNLDCSVAVSLLDELVRGELGREEAQDVGRHLEGCPACSAEALRARRAFTLVKLVDPADEPEGMDEAMLTRVRSRALAEVRELAAERQAQRGWLGWSWAAVGGVAAAALLAAVLPGAPTRTTTPLATSLAASPSAVAADAEAVDVQHFTVASGEGVTLRWQGPGATYVVLKSHRPGSFETAEKTVVCGSSWTDRAQDPGPAYYRVLRAPKDC